MQYQVSAGGVIIFFQKSQPLKVLLLKDKSGKWTFPKGLIKKNEKKSDAAQREIAEEVSIKKLIFLFPLTPIEYIYKWEGKLVKKMVYYFVFLSKKLQKPTPQREEGILDVQWFDWKKAVEVLGYPKTNKQVLKEVREKLNEIKMNDLRFKI